ncbi:MAG: metallopeptidase family protein [Longimicrobiales bacterium]
MKFADFERAAREAYTRIPEAYKAGIDGLVVSREAPTHPDPEVDEIWTLGECLTEEYASDWGGPETTRSQVVLYWGSFQNLARRDEHFDWEEELWETLTHELRHHLESLAGEDDLEGVDYAADQTFMRDQGRDFDPWYFQHGETVAPGVYQVERNLYVEQEWREDAFGAAPALEFEFEGRRWRVPRPEELGDVHFVWVHGVVDAPRTLELVLVRTRSWWEDVKRLVGATRPEVLESEVDAEPVAPEPQDDGG